MTTGIYGYWLALTSHNFSYLRYRTDPLPPGSRAYATIALSSVTEREPNDWPTYATAVIEAYSTYNPDGSESAADFFPEPAFGDDPPMLFVNNPCRILFRLGGQRVVMRAQASIFLF